MVRTTLSLPQSTRRKLRRLAAERGVSMATIVREAIDEKIERLSPKPRSLGAGSSGNRETARRRAGRAEARLATLDHRHFATMRPRHVDSLQLLPG